jgi:hypothetical protein
MLAATPAYSSFGPFRVSDADSNSVRIAFSVQTRFDFESKDQGDHADRTKKLYGYFRTLRPVLSGSFLDNRLGCYFQLNSAPGALELMDMYFDWNPGRNVQVRFGQSKVPFTHFRNQSRLRSTFVDWPIVSPYFGAERQVGFCLHNGLDKPPVYEYVFGIYDGANARASHGIGLAKAYKITPVNPSDLSGEGGKYEFNPELFLRLSYNPNGIDLQSDTDPDRGPLRYSLGTSIAWDLKAEMHVDFNWRIAPEILAKYEGLSVGLIGYAGGSRMGEEVEVKPAMVGWLVRAAYRIDERWEVSARAASVHLRCDLTNDLERHGIDYARHNHDELSLGVNHYLVGHNLKVQGTVDWQRYFTGRTDLFVQTQFQLAF